jgi:hypothetical protein
MFGAHEPPTTDKDQQAATTTLTADAKHVIPPLFAFPHIRDVSAGDLATFDTFFRANMLPCCTLYLDRVDAGGSAVGSHRCGPDPLLPAAVTWWVGAL